MCSAELPARQLFSPVWSERLTRQRLRSGKVIFSDAGREVRCSRCGDYWPGDTEFYYQGGRRGGLHEWCKACYESWRSAR